MTTDLMTTGLPPIGLADLLEIAELQTRVDRKYLLPRAAVGPFLAALDGELAVLEIDGARRFAYESVYFDTPDLASYLSSARSRRHRFKIRTRTYLDSGSCLLEIKTRTGAATVKTRFGYHVADRHQLTPEAVRLLEADGHVPDDVTGLVPALMTLYDRATFLHAASGTRVTCDSDVRFEDPTSGTVTTRPDVVVVEAKSEDLSGPVDRVLWRAGYRPVSMSKYGTGMALLHPHLPANKWNRTLRHHFGWRPSARPEHVADAAHGVDPR